MKKKLALPTCAGFAVALLLLGDTCVRADSIPWGYNWQPSTTKLTANAGGSGYLSLTDEPANSATGSSNTIVTNIHAVSTAPTGTPDTFNHAAISFAMQLTDSASKQSTTVTFSGYFSGTLTANSSNVMLTITSPKTDTVTLGGNTYTVALGSYTPPGPSGAVNAGSLNAFVSVTAGSSGGGHTSGSGGTVPEPSSVLLAGLALPYLGWFGWRKRRAKKVAGVMA
jgi:hypothetical protein